MTYGPIDLIVPEFPGNRFKGEILPCSTRILERVEH
jgi:hypothetical protein